MLIGAREERANFSRVLSSYFTDKCDRVYSGEGDHQFSQNGAMVNKNICGFLKNLINNDKVHHALVYRSQPIITDKLYFLLTLPHHHLNKQRNHILLRLQLDQQRQDNLANPFF